jgi:hypothetical protein
VKSLQSSLKVAGLLALALGPLPVVLAQGMGLEAAFAENSKGNGGGNGNSGGVSESKGSDNKGGGQTKGADNGKGDLASELKGMNAVHANPKALENADPNSQVGKIAAYKDAALATQAAEDAVKIAETELAAANEALVAAEAVPATTDEETAAKAAAIEAANTAIASATAAVDSANAALTTAAADEEAALLLASDGRILSDEAIAYIRKELGP